MPPKAVHLVVRGRVQGVGFRAWTQHQGQLRGLRGWVRNRRDGSVEAVVAGPAEAVDLMVEACRAGPMTARVEALEASPVDPAEAGEGGFEQRATA